jgi:hypothetical protein
VLFDRGRRGPALKDFDICGDRDWFNVFEVLVPGALSPIQELSDCPVVGGSGVRVADWDRKELEEFFASRRAGAGDDGWSCGRIYGNNGKFGDDLLAVALYLNRRLRSQGVHDLNTVNHCT